MAGRFLALLILGSLVAAQDGGRRAQAMGFVRLLGDEKLASMAERSLLAMGDDATEALAFGLADLNSSVRVEAARVLGSIDSEASRKALLRAANDRAGRVRVAACLSLLRLNDTSDPVIAGLARGLADPDEATRRAASEGLSQAGRDAKSAIPALIGALGDRDEVVRRQAEQALAGMGVVTVDRLRADGTASDDPVQRAAAVRTLGRLGADAKASVPNLVELLVGDASDQVRIDAARALGKMGEAAEGAVPALRDLAEGRGTKTNLRVAALNALEAIGAGGDEDELRRMLLESPQPMVRAYAARRLGATKATDAAADLMLGLNDVSHMVRAESAMALALAAPDSDETLLVLTAALDNRFLVAPREAARALGAMGAKASSAKDALQEAAVQAEDEELAAAAKEALDKIG